MTALVLGAVLAGGASSRFGSDKAQAMVDGRTLLDHARSMLAAVVGEVVVVGRPGGVADLPEPGLGPLGGIAGALDHAARHGFASVLTIGCDMPRVPAALLTALLAEAPACCSDAPVLGHWPTALGGGLIDRLSSSFPAARTLPATRRDGLPGKNAALSVRRWALEVGAVAIPTPVPLRNVNTPADLVTS